MTLSEFLAPLAALLALPVGSRVPSPLSDGGAGSRPSIVEAPSSDIEPFGLLSLACYSAENRDRTALEEIEAAEAVTRPGGRSQGLEWAYVELFETTDRLRQAAELMGQLARHEGLVRAILAASPAQCEAARAALTSDPAPAHE